MKIVKIEWRNIFSYGDKIEQIEFGSTGRLIQLTGVSGVGKTSLLSIPKLLLFGKTEDSDGKAISVTDIANRVNKHGWIRGTIIKGNDTYVIERTFSPSGLSIIKNNKEIDVAGIKNMQSVIDSEILDNLSYSIFSNIMTLSLNKFKSFISMSPADKRTIIDKIFSLEIINKVHEFIRRDMKELGDNINMSKNNLFTINNALSATENEIVKIKNISASDTGEDDINSINEKINKVTTLYNTYKTYYDKAYMDLETAKSFTNTVQYELSRLSYTLSDLNNKKNLFNNDECPLCGAKLSGPFYEDKLTKIESDIEEETKLISEYNNKLNENEINKNELSKSLESISNDMRLISNKYAELLSKKTILETKQNSDLNAIVSLENVANVHKESVVKLETDIKVSNEQMEYLSIMEKLYSSDGIKTIMMNNYIPSLNEEIDETLNALGFPYRLEFDANFEPVMYDLGEEIRPQTLSTGEHKKVDLAVLCAILKVLKRKYPQLNLICLDETVSSLDYESSSNVISHLKDIANDMGINIFVVSHTQLDDNLFDVHFHIEKNAGFSEIIND